MEQGYQTDHSNINGASNSNSESACRRIGPREEDITSSNVEPLNIILRSLGHQSKPSNEAPTNPSGRRRRTKWTEEEEKATLSKGAARLWGTRWRDTHRRTSVEHGPHKEQAIENLQTPGHTIHSQGLRPPPHRFIPTSMDHQPVKVDGGGLDPKSDVRLNSKSSNTISKNGSKWTEEEENPTLSKRPSGALGEQGWTLELTGHSSYPATPAWTWTWALIHLEWWPCADWTPLAWLVVTWHGLALSGLAWCC